MAEITKFTFEHTGIGDVLYRLRLNVPANQRSYAWEKNHVEDLFTDLSSAIMDNKSDYFLGTIVLTQLDDSIREVADGQQRLATVSILLAAIRDRFFLMGRDQRATSIDNSYLRQLAEDADDVVPKLKLNMDDADFFTRYVLANEDERKHVDQSNLHESSQRILDALNSAVLHVGKILAQYRNDEDKAKILLEWVSYLRTQATVVVVTVPSSMDAYRMFETLNDRGLRASQADLLKNYFFSRVQNRLDEAQTKWSSISGAIESIGDNSDLVTYIRHYWICRNGPTKEKDLADSIRQAVSGETNTMNFLVELENRVRDYVALFNPSSKKWFAYTDYCRDYVRVFIDDLRVEQVRPLLFAIATYLIPPEAEKALLQLVSWSVRFLIVGGRGGNLDRIYSLCAQDIGTGKVQTAKQLTNQMREHIPQDVPFEEAFKTASVSRNWLARYYLRCLDLTLSKESEPERIANRNKEVVNLEHILTYPPGPDWNIGEDVAKAHYRRLGNLVLLQATKNVEADRDGFADKKKIYAKSKLPITKQAAEYENWTIDEINDRQKKMAKLAVKAWPSGL